MYGFAVENLLKALWIKRGNKIVINGKFVGPTGVKGHDLPKLAKLVDFETSKEEGLVLCSLKIKIVSSARYPIGTSWSKQCYVRLDNGGFKNLVTLNDKDIPHIESIAAKLIKILGYDD